jgi:hypothetical protein
MSAVSWASPLDAGVTAFDTGDYWAGWARNNQAAHAARMVAVAWIVLATGGRTKKAYVGKLWTTAIIVTLDILWHSFQEVSFWAYASGGSIAPPWIRNWTPQSLPYEIFLDLIAAVWALGTSLVLRLPCLYNIEEEAKADSDKRMETEAAAAVKAGVPAEGKAAKLHLSLFMRMGGAALAAWLFYPLAAVMFGPILLCVFMTPVIGDVDATAFRLDALIWTLVAAAIVTAYWFAVYMYHWRYGVYYVAVTKKARGTYKRRVILGGVVHVFSVVAAGLFCIYPFMSGLDFLQPLYGFAAAAVATLVTWGIGELAWGHSKAAQKIKELRDRRKAKEKQGVQK